MSHRVRPMTSDDLGVVGAIYAATVGAAPPPTWRAHVETVIDRDQAAFVSYGSDGRVTGYLVGEVRSWEFGSPPAGWIFALAVPPEHRGGGAARALTEAALGRFRRLGVSNIRTMVRRDDVDVLRFFRAAGFAAGPYTELELELEG